jgi:hypothetical protein
MTEDWRKELVEKIETAFASTPSPRKQGFTTEGWYFETEGIEGKHWTEIELKVLIKHRDDPNFFTLEQLRFYLPAFLRVAVLHTDEMDTLPYTLNSLLIPPRPDDKKRADEELRKVMEHWPDEAKATMEKSFDQSRKMQHDDPQRDAREMRHFIDRVNFFSREERSAIAAYMGAYWKLLPGGIYAHENLEREQIERATKYWAGASAREGVLAATEPERKELVKQIESAFAGVPYPGDDNVGHEELQGFRGNWKTIPVEVVSSHSDRLAKFSVNGLRHYLPAFLRAALLDPHGPRALPYYVTSILTPPPDAPPDDLDLADAETIKIIEDWINSYPQRVQVFSPQEKVAIYEFIRFFAEYYSRLYSEADWAYRGSEREQDLERTIAFWAKET